MRGHRIVRNRQFARDFSGGHARVGFENNLYLPNGEVADSTSALISSLVGSLHDAGDQPASSEQAAQLLGVRKV